MDKQRRRWLRWGLRLLVYSILLIMLLRWFEHKQVYQPSRNWATTGADLGRPWEDVTFPALDGTQLSGWFFPANTNSPRKDWVFLICPGNAGNISHRLELTQVLLRTGANVFLFDYRGYGRSAGKPSEEGTYQDAQGACAWLRQKGFRTERIIAHGESLGGGIASELALREPLGGLILHSTFTSIPDVGAEFFPWLPVRTMSRIRYDTLTKLPRLKLPVLIVHSRVDSVIAYHHGERNFAAALEPKQFCEITGDHNDSPLAKGDSYLPGLEKFVTMLEARATQ